MVDRIGVCVQLDVSHLRAASNDPAQHHDKAPGFRLGSIYSIPQDEYDKVSGARLGRQHGSSRRVSERD